MEFGLKPVVINHFFSINAKRITFLTIYFGFEIGGIYDLQFVLISFVINILFQKKVS